MSSPKAKGGGIGTPTNNSFMDTATMKRRPETVAVPMSVAKHTEEPYEGKLSRTVLEAGPGWRQSGPSQHLKEARALLEELEGR